MYPDFIPNTDNLFKFLFIGGIVLIFTAVFYPMQKSQEIEIETTIYNKEVELLNNEIKNLNDAHLKLKLAAKKANSILGKLQKEKNTASSVKEKALVSQKINNIKQTILPSYDSVHNKLQDLVVKNIILKYNKEKVKLLKEYSQEYSNYKFWFLLSGGIFGLIGIAGWSYLTYKDIYKPSP